LAYRWPVERIGADYQPAVAPAAPTLLLVYRDAQLKVRFARLAPMAYRLLALEQGSGRARLEALGGGVEEGLALLEGLREQGVIICTC